MANSWTSNGVVDGRYKFSYTADQASTTSVILTTENKFVDKNILIQSTVPAASLTKGAGAVSINVQNATLLGTSAASAPASGPYIKITGSGTVSVTASGAGGWLNKNTSLSSNEANLYYPIKIAAFTVSNNVVYCSSAGYVPEGSSTSAVGTVNTSSVTTNTSYSNMGTYFDSTTAGGSPSVTITPQYKNDAGYITAHTSWTNNGGVGYWKIKTTSVSVTSTVVSNGAVSRAASASWGTGWISTISIGTVVFGSTAASGKTDASYVDISGTNAAPVLVSGSYLYINSGYIDNVKISLAKLVPNDASVTAVVNGTSPLILSGETAYDKEGNLITGSIPSLAATSYTPRATDQVIQAGYYLAGAQTIIGDENLIAANIVTGKTIFGIDGTFSAQSTSAITSSVILKNYVGYVNGQKVTGSMETRTVSVTYTPTSLTTYFTDLGTTATAGTYQVTIVPKYTVSAGYVAAKTDQAGTTRYYQIKIATLSATAGNVALTSDTTAQSSTTPTLPFSIYSSSVTRNIKITTAATTAAMGNNRVYIKVEGSGAVAASTTGWLDSTASVASTTATRYISMDYYTGTYSIP